MPATSKRCTVSAARCPTVTPASLAFGWWILSEVELRLDHRLLVPDMLGFRVERVPELPDENPLRIISDWCCEILSPAQPAMIA